MSVYRRGSAKNFSYDFQLQNLRFSGTLPTANEREAKRLEKEIREREKIKLAASKGTRPDGRMTLEVATSRYWDEVGQHHKNASTTWKSLGWLTAAIGSKTLLDQISDDLVAELVAKRRAETKPTNRKKKKKDAPPPKLVGPATVNRTMTEVLRKVMNRAQNVWKVSVGDITWRQHFLKEPKERIREATEAEESGVMAELERGYDDAVAFAFASGCRRGEIVPRDPNDKNAEERYRGLVWRRVDFGNRQFIVVGKGGKERIIPMTTTLFKLLWRQQGNHTEHVFTYEAARTLKKEGLERVRGQRYPITDAGLRTAMRRAVDGAGVTNLRFHDTRHTMATRTLRSSNIKVVQNMLGHERITTTEKYAHAMVEDIRAGMEAAIPTKSPTVDDVASDNDMVSIEKSA